MSSHDDIIALVEMSGVRPMTGGFHVSIRAELWDVSPAKPLGLDYGLTLMDGNGDRVLGFDNKHAFDGASADTPWDHEHRAGVPGQTFEYRFTSVWQLISDFFERVESFISDYERKTGIKLAYLEEAEQ